MLFTATFFEPTTVVMTTTTAATTTTFADQQSLQDWRRRCWVLRKSRQATSWRKSTNQIQCAIAMPTNDICTVICCESRYMFYIYIVVQYACVLWTIHKTNQAQIPISPTYIYATVMRSFTIWASTMMWRAREFARTIPCASHICYVERRGGVVHTDIYYYALCAYTHHHHSLRASSRMYTEWIESQKKWRSERGRTNAT